MQGIGMTNLRFKAYVYHPESDEETGENVKRIFSEEGVAYTTEANEYDPSMVGYTFKDNPKITRRFDREGILVMWG